MNWHDLSIENVTRIDRVADEFHVWAHVTLPFPKFKVKVLERRNGDFLGIPNVAVKNLEDGTPVWISGIGNTVEQALEDALRCFLATVEGRVNLTEEDFEWSDPSEF